MSTPHEFENAVVAIDHIAFSFYICQIVCYWNFQIRTQRKQKKLILVRRFWNETLQNEFILQTSTCSNRSNTVIFIYLKKATYNFITKGNEITLVKIFQMYVYLKYSNEKQCGLEYKKIINQRNWCVYSKNCIQFLSSYSNKKWKKLCEQNVRYILINQI